MKTSALRRWPVDARLPRPLLEFALRWRDKPHPIVRAEAGSEALRADLASILGCDVAAVMIRPMLGEKGWQVEWKT